MEYVLIQRLAPILVERDAGVERHRQELGILQAVPDPWSSAPSWALVFARAYHVRSSCQGPLGPHPGCVYQMRPGW